MCLYMIRWRVENCCTALPARSRFAMLFLFRCRQQVVTGHKHLLKTQQACSKFQHRFQTSSLSSSVWRAASSASYTPSQVPPGPPWCRTGRTSRADLHLHQVEVELFANQAPPIRTPKSGTQPRNPGYHEYRYSHIDIMT